MILEPVLLMLMLLALEQILMDQSPGGECDTMKNSGFQASSLPSTTLVSLMQLRNRIHRIAQDIEVIIEGTGRDKDPMLFDVANRNLPMGTGIPPASCHPGPPHDHLCSHSGQLMEMNQVSVWNTVQW